jgi:hypothetical protein
LRGCFWRNYLHLMPNWMHCKSFIYGGVTTWKRYLHLLANWMHFNCASVQTSNNYLHVLANWMHSKSLVYENVLT